MQYLNAVFGEKMEIQPLQLNATQMQCSKNKPLVLWLVLHLLQHFVYRFHLHVKEERGLHYSIDIWRLGKKVLPPPENFYL